MIQTRKANIVFLRVNDKGEVIGLEDEHTATQLVCRHCGNYTWSNGTYCQWCGKLPLKAEIVYTNGSAK